MVASKRVDVDASRDVAVVRMARRLEGRVNLPPDKSIAHRSAMFAALADGDSTICNFPTSADPLSTLSCMRQLGIRIDSDGDVLRVEGRGLEGFSAPAGPIDCGNSGTTMRLLCGILAAQPFDSMLVGDDSLSQRPMDRIALPLREMGAHITLTNGHPPIVVEGGRSLRGLTYRLPMASAQVKSCVLLAGLYASGRTTVVETGTSRDHTERMLGLTAFEKEGERRIVVEQGHRIAARDWAVPRDFSAAAFFMVAGATAGEGEIRLEGVGLNPTRGALIDVLRAMGADIQVSNERDAGGEPVGDLLIRPSELTGITVSGNLVSILIDEIPVLAVAGALSGGRTEIRDARELRVKETDRIRATVDNLRLLGAEVEEFDDGLAVVGGHSLRGAEVRSFGDHRMAMAMAVAGVAVEGETVITGASCTAVSFPAFWEELSAVAHTCS